MSPIETDDFWFETIVDLQRSDKKPRGKGTKSAGRRRRKPRVHPVSQAIWHTGSAVRGALGWGTRLLLLLVGGILVLVGMIFGLTMIGSICGLPLILVGIVLVVKGLVV